MFLFCPQAVVQRYAVLLAVHSLHCYGMRVNYRGAVEEEKERQDSWRSAVWRCACKCAVGIHRKGSLRRFHSHARIRKALAPFSIPSHARFRNASLAPVVGVITCAHCRSSRANKVFLEFTGLVVFEWRLASFQLEPYVYFQELKVYLANPSSLSDLPCQLYPHATSP